MTPEENNDLMEAIASISTDFSMPKSQEKVVVLLPELPPMKPKSKITIYIDIPNLNIYNKEVKLLPTLKTSDMIVKLQKKKILTDGTWNITHVPKMGSLDTKELLVEGKSLWDLGLRDQVYHLHLY